MVWRSLPTTAADSHDTPVDRRIVSEARDRVDRADRVTLRETVKIFAGKLSAGQVSQ